MPAKKINLETKTQEVKARKSTAPATKKSPKTAPKTSAKSKKPTPVKVAKSSSPAPSPVFSQDQVATRAYYIGERRQTMGWPGDPSTDWIEAEAQLIAEAKRKKT